MKKYSEHIFGGIQHVKELYVEELRRLRTMRGLSPEELTTLLKLGPDWPTIKEVEDNPRLFTRKLYQAIWHPEATDDVEFNWNNIVTRDPLISKITEFLSKKDTLEQVLSEFRAKVKIRTTGEASLNSVKSEVYAQGYIFSDILHELGNTPLPAS